jgi:hypothetical protein
MRSLAALSAMLGAALLLSACGSSSPSSVGTDQLQNDSVTSSKIANGAVTSSKIANNAVGKDQLATDAVNSSKVKDDSLTGDDIDESTLGTVPEAQDAKTLGGIPASEFLRLDIKPVEVTSPLNSTDKKSITASCPSGYKVISGGAEIVGEKGKPPAALTGTATNAGNGWVGEAQEFTPTTATWAIRVIALCVAPAG